MNPLLRRTALPALWLAALMSGACSGPEPPDAEPSVLVQVTPLVTGSLPRIITVYGTVQASAASRRTIMAPTAARVVAVAVRPGERVARGAPLVRLEPTPGTAAAFAQARSALTVARQLLTRTRQLLSQHLATRQQLADAQRSESDARAALAALQAEGAGGLHVIRAPAAAIVTAVTTSRGAVVAEGAALLELAAADGLVLHAGIVPSGADDIERGDPALITPVGGARAVRGIVSLRGAAVDPATGLTPIEITVPAGTLQPGETARADITTGEASGFRVPHEAILVDDSGDPYVVQAVRGGAHKVSVRVLASQGDLDVIAGALAPSAPLVLAGNYQLQDGMKLRVRQARQTRSPTAGGARSPQAQPAGPPDGRAAR